VLGLQARFGRDGQLHGEVSEARPLACCGTSSAVKGMPPVGSAG